MIGYGNDAASLRQRYGNAPETVDQWRTMNGFNQPWQAAPQQIIPTKWGPPVANEPQQMAPGGSSSPAAPQGGGTDYNSYLQGLIGKAGAYDPTAGINDAFRQMREYVGQQTVGDATAQMGERGLLPSDNTSQDLKAVLMGRAMNPIAVQHAQALANAGQQGLQNQMSLASLLSDARRQDQAQAWQQQQHEYQKQQDALNNQWRQQQANTANQQWQSQFDWNKQQASTQNIHGGITDPQGNPIAPGGEGNLSPGLAPIPQNNTPSFFDLIGRAPGSPAPTSGGGAGGGEAPAARPGMGGGSGIDSYNSGAGPESSGYYQTPGGGTSPFRPVNPWRPTDAASGQRQDPMPGQVRPGMSPTPGTFSSYTPEAPGIGGGIAGAGAGARGGSSAPNAGSGLFGTPTNSTGATTWGGIKSASPGQVASAPFPGVSGSGTYTTLPPRPPAPAPQRKV